MLHNDNNNDIIFYNTVLHVREGACVRALMGARACVRARAYICTYYFYIILLYMRAQFVRTCVRTCMYGLPTYMRTYTYAYVCVGACAYAIARVQGCACVRMCVRNRLQVFARVGACEWALAGAGTFVRA